MYLFLTGPPGVGKSTALRRTLALLGRTPGGFRTGFAPGRDRLCLWPAWREPDWAEEGTVARMTEGRPVPDPAAFDRLGPAFLKESCPWASMFLLDELGRLEGEAMDFQRAVLACLEGDRPVLGVIKPHRAGSWLEELAARPGVEVMMVTGENRDTIPNALADRLRPILKLQEQKRRRRS